LALSHTHSPRWRNLNSILSSNQDGVIREKRKEKASKAKGFERGAEYYKSVEEGGVK
jgi:hypothetical protein